MKKTDKVITPLETSPVETNPHADEIMQNFVTEVSAKLGLNEDVQTDLHKKIKELFTEFSQQRSPGN
jgi:hypothetical protein